MDLKSDTIIMAKKYLDDAIAYVMKHKTCTGSANKFETQGETFEVVFRRVRGG